MAKGFRGAIDFTGARSGRPPTVRYYPGKSSASMVEVLLDPWSGTPIAAPQTIYERTSIGLRSCGSPYFALVQRDTAGAFGIGGSEMALLVTAAIHALPTMLADPDEIHYLFSVHEPKPSGVELFSLGITPSGRLACKTVQRTLRTPINQVVADGSRHLYGMQVYSPTGPLDLSIDGEVIVTDTAEAGEEAIRAPSGTDPIRFVAFNGIEGLSRYEATIYHVEMPNENHGVGWLFTERHGSVVYDYEYAVSPEEPTTFAWRKRADMPASPAPGSSDFAGDWSLETAWYNPSSLGFPLLWGTVPGSSPASCATWERRTIYTPRNAAAVTYTPVPRPTP